MEVNVVALTSMVSKDDGDDSQDEMEVAALLAVDFVLFVLDRNGWFGGSIESTLARSVVWLELSLLAIT